MNTRTRINLLSGPRNISTAMMYSFAQRDDTVVVDEPFYAFYLKETGLQHPGKEEVLQSQEHDPVKVTKQIVENDFGKPVVFFKQMTHHLLHVDLEFLSQTKNILLIRDPKKVLISYSKVIERPTLADIGIKQSFDLYEWMVKENFHHVVVDSDDVLKDPEAMLRRICYSTGINFQKEMLHWKAGPRPEDGVWAKHWYKNVHRSTGFAPFEEEDVELKASLFSIYPEAKKYYDLLLPVSLKA